MASGVYWATFGLVLFFHLAILFALPAMLFVAIVETHRRKLGRHGYAVLLLAAVPAVFFWYLVRYCNWGSGEMVGEHFVIPYVELFRRPWLIFVDEMLPVKFWFLVWNAGVAAPLAVWIFVRALWRKPDTLSLYYLIYFCAFICFTLLWNPDMKERDFDLFCFPWVIATVVVAHRVMQLPARALWVGLLLGVNLNLWVIRPALWAEVGERGTGTVLIDTLFRIDGYPPHAGNVLMDNRFGLRATNKFVPCGYHTISLISTVKPMVERVICVEPGKVYLYKVDIDGIYLQSILPEQPDK